MSQTTGDGKDAILRGARTRPIASVAGSGLYARRRTLPPVAPPEEDEVGALAKGLFLAVTDVLPRYAKEAVVPEMKELETRVAAGAGALLQKELASRDAGHAADLTALGERFSDALDRQAKLYEERLANQAVAHADALERLHKAHREGMAQLAALLKALPVPTVNVPAGAITVKSEPSVVHVRPQITTPAPVVNVKNDAPVVNLPAPVVNVQQAAAPQVKIDKGALAVTVKSEPSVVHFAVPPGGIKLLPPAPRKTKVTKSVIYGPDGRPQSIEETTEEKETTDE